MSRFGLLSVALAALALAVALSACGNDSDSAPADGNRVTMREYQFEPKHLAVSRGTTLKVFNDGEIAHNLVIARGTDPLKRPDKLLATPTFLGGQTRELKVDVPPGKYLILSSVPGQRQLGMYGTITVN